MNISVLGAGAWGTAMAIAFAERNDVLLWGRAPVHMREMASTRENARSLPGHPLPATLRLTDDWEVARRHAAGEQDMLVVATSISGLRAVLERCRTAPVARLIWLCKGFEEDSGLLPHQVVESVLGAQVACGALSGPSFAQEVARGLPCALTVASRDTRLCQDVVTALHGKSMRVYSTDDLIGVEVGGAVKNIMAIATGISDGLGLGMNARAALMTRGLAEMTRFGVALGARPETLMGLTGMGDLMLTCTGDLSRNRRVGLALAAGQRLEDIVSALGHVAEGVRCAQTVHALAQARNVDMPITEAVCSVLFEQVPAHVALTQLLAREAKQECC